MKNSLIARFFQDENGATALEYAIMTVGISIGVGVTVNLSGDGIVQFFRNIADAI